MLRSGILSAAKGFMVRDARSRWPSSGSCQIWNVSHGIALTSATVHLFRCRAKQLNSITPSIRGPRANHSLSNSRSEMDAELIEPIQIDYSPVETNFGPRDRESFARAYRRFMRSRGMRDYTFSDLKNMECAEAKNRKAKNVSNRSRA